MSRGCLIVLEGLDGVGKTTQCKMLLESLNQRGLKSQMFRFPDRSTPTGQQIDRYLLREIELDDQAIHLLFAENRRESQARLRELLEVEKVNVIVDRYAPSGVAYSAAKGLDLKWCKGVDADNLAPDVVLFLDVNDPSMLAPRLSHRQGAQERYETLEFQLKVQQCYRDLAPSLGDRWVKFPATPGIEEVHLQLLNHLFTSSFSQSSLPPLISLRDLGW